MIPKAGKESGFLSGRKSENMVEYLQPIPVILAKRPIPSININNCNKWKIFPSLLSARLV